ncbi:AMP-binding enzyme, partial [Burkholderia catarinensis]|uniref:AMP-binding enzyme n=1 Tax=Burkholderia catarinensis TaxID=1108140 RepID=UPI003FD8B614
YALPDFTYINRPDARVAMEREGLITLGDVGYIDEDGFLHICDRKADMVISGGVNIYPAEIESVLLTMPGIEDCAVFGIPDMEFGESLAAAVQRAGGPCDRSSGGSGIPARAHCQLQGTKPHRNPRIPAARGQRQDIQTAAA